MDAYFNNFKFDDENIYEKYHDLYQNEIHEYFLLKES
jgi:hypothetical protein